MMCIMLDGTVIVCSMVRRILGVEFAASARWATAKDEDIGHYNDQHLTFLLHRRAARTHTKAPARQNIVRRIGFVFKVALLRDQSCPPQGELLHF